MSTEDERCDMTELLRRECDHCRKHDTQAIARPTKLHTRPKATTDFVEAKYKGMCSVCGDEIVPGDYISVVQEVTAGDGVVVKKLWAHYGCTDD